MEIQGFVDKIKAASEDGFTVAEVGQLLGGFCREVVTAVDQFQASGTTKKELVMSWVKEAVDVLVAAVPLPLWLRPFGPVVRRVAAGLLVTLADGLVESAVTALRERG